MPNTANIDPKDWAILEGRVRRTASYIWDAPARPEQVNGVNVDAVIKREPDYWVCVEITTHVELPKLREDLAKFAAIKPYLMSQNIHAKCVFVGGSEPPPSLVTTGKGLNVDVLSVESLERLLIDYVAYETARRAKPFGSAVNPISGERDESLYVPVKYSERGGAALSVGDIAARLMMGQKIVLQGEYGTGKSRCFRELFAELSSRAVGAGKFPVAIDLRDNWGMKRGPEIVRRHFDDLGLGKYSDAAVKVFDKSSLIFLLDGFDEIGSQAWSDDHNKLKYLRKHSLAGVRDLLSQVKGGAIVSGRAHYFNSDEEMFDALGLNPKETVLLQCQSEFTEAEMEQFLARMNQELALPSWLPRRPLICQTIAGLEEDDLDRMFVEEGGEVDFWQRLIDVICEREARIAPPLVPENIKNVLRALARATRSRPANVGPLSTTEVNRAFEAALGFPPVAESAIMLQRLPALGRVGAESSDRQFIDVYILDGLRGLDVSHTVKTPAEGCENEPWSNPLQKLGQAVAALDVRSGNVGAKVDSYLRHARRCLDGRNRVLGSDIVGSLLVSGGLNGSVDFHGLSVKSGHFLVLDLARSTAANLTIDDSIVEEIFLPTLEPKNVSIRKCIIGTMHRIASALGAPSWISETETQRFETVSTVAQIRAADLTPNQRILVTIVKKTFFQKGGGRKEEALLRGLGSTPATADPSKVVNLLVRKDVLEPKKASGGGGTIYIPNRALSARMKKMIAELTLSKDEIWDAATKL